MYIFFQDTTHRLSNIGEGLWGTLKILENGKAYIAVGKEKVPVEMTRYCPKQVSPGKPPSLVPTFFLHMTPQTEFFKAYHYYY